MFIFRNLDVGEDNEKGEHEENDGNLVSGLNCKIVVQFEGHKDFYNALKVLCGRSLNKVGKCSFISFHFLSCVLNALGLLVFFKGP